MLIGQRQRNRGYRLSEGWLRRSFGQHRSRPLGTRLGGLLDEKRRDRLDGS